MSFTPELMVLHTLRCIGTTSTERLADRAGLDEDATESHLIDLGVGGLVSRQAGAFGGWRITDQGRAVDAEAVATQLTETGCRAAVEAAFGRFERLNPLALEACTAWQLRTVDGATVVNDHLDRRYDTQVLRKIASVEQHGQEVCNDLASVLDRFEGYGPRLRDASRRALAGEWELVSEHPDSFHSLWFQLHEDLLVTLGRPRH